MTPEGVLATVPSSFPPLSDPTLDGVSLMKSLITALRPVSGLVFGTVAVFAITTLSPDAGAVAPGKTTKPPATNPNLQKKKPRAKRPPVSGEAAKGVRRAELTHLEIGTETDGTWFWRATVANTGNQPIQRNDMQVRGTQLPFAPAHQSPKGASGSILTGDLAPGNSLVVKRYWTRCCYCKELKVDLWDAVNNRVVNTKTISQLIHRRGGSISVFDYEVENVMWNASTKAWTASVKNNTSYNLKVVVQANVLPGGDGAPKAAGGRRLVLAPNATTTVGPVRQSWIRSGDKLRVGLAFDGNKLYCNHDQYDCGKGYRVKTIP